MCTDHAWLSTNSKGKIKFLCCYQDCVPEYRLAGRKLIKYIATWIILLSCLVGLIVFLILDYKHIQEMLQSELTEESEIVS